LRDDAARVDDIVEACVQLQQHVAADHERFVTDPVIQAASQRWLEIIGEAAANLSDDFKAGHPGVPWREIIGMRTILAHGYFDIDLDVVWQAVSVDVPELLRAIRST
jgi:uncharacterized protein with HEPN domain